jgi:hypothetical protein
MGEEACKLVFGGSPEGKIQLERPRRGCEDNIVTCYLRSQPIQRFVAGQQLRRYATVLETLLGSRPRVTMEVQLEEVLSMWSVPRSYLEDTWGELPVVSFKFSC